MDAKISTVEYKDNNFYFLYTKKFTDTGIKTPRWQEHSFHEIMYIEEGEIEYAIESKRYVLKKGDVLLVNAGNYHFERNVIKAPIALYCLGFFTENVKCEGISFDIFDKGEHFSLGESSAFEKILSAAKQKLELSNNNAPAFIKSVVQASLFILSDLDIIEEKGEEIRNGTVRKIISYVNKNLTTIKSAEAIAEAMFFSTSYVRALFQREMGIGIMEYVRKKRVLLAHRKMKHGKKPSEIYAECGFSNYTSFYRAYIDYFGYTPKMVKKL